MTDAIGTLTRRVLFSPLSDSGRTETVVERIRSAIMLGIFADGEQLPNEIELAAQFQVSPVTLRDALRVIRDEGLARTKRGRSGGTFVIAPDESNMGMFEQRLGAVSALELRDLLDWQSALNSHSAYLAAERASPAEIEALDATALLMGATTDAPPARRILSRFLIGVSASARSARLTREIITLQIEIAPHNMLVLRDPNVRIACHQHASAVVSAIRAQHPEQAHTASIALIGYLSDRLLELRHALTRPVVDSRRGIHA